MDHDSIARQGTRCLRLLLPALLLWTAVGCEQVGSRSNPLDLKGTLADWTPRLSADWEQGALTLRWMAAPSDAVLAYRLYRADGDAEATLLAEVAHGPLVDLPQQHDTRALMAGVEARYRLTFTVVGGESGVRDEASYVTTEDVDGDGFSADDCALNDAAVFPGAVEACNQIDDDCDGHVDEAGACGDVEALCVDPPHACPTGLACALDMGRCLVPCDATPCTAGATCIGGSCLPTCTDSSQCIGDGESCVFPPQEPPVLGGCAALTTCSACGPDALCVRNGDGDSVCCADADGDGRFDLGCPWGTDCDDTDPAIWNQCDTCATSDDCGGAQCVLVGGDGAGVCGGPAGCHCPAGSACSTAVDPPACIGAVPCDGQPDCDQVHGGGWACLDAPSGLGTDKRCTCTDRSLCPGCMVDAECGEGNECVAGECALTRADGG